MFVSMKAHNELKKSHEALEENLNKLKERIAIVMERQDLLVDNDVALKQAIDKLEKEKKTTYFG